MGASSLFWGQGGAPAGLNSWWELLSPRDLLPGSTQTTQLPAGELSSAGKHRPREKGFPSAHTETRWQSRAQSSREGQELHWRHGNKALPRKDYFCVQWQRLGFTATGEPRIETKMKGKRTCPGATCGEGEGSRGGPHTEFSHARWIQRHQKRTELTAACSHPDTTQRLLPHPLPSRPQPVAP